MSIEQTLPADRPVQIAPTYRLQWEEAQQSYVLLYPEGMVTLNPSASEVLRRCDGARTVGDIIGDLERNFPDVELRSDVLEFLDTARERGWIRV